MIEIEAEHRKLIAALDEPQRLLELLAEQRSVRQVGQRIVARHVGNLFLGLLPFGDVLECRDPAAALHRLIDDADRTSVLDDCPGRGVAGVRFRHQSGNKLRGIAVPLTDRLLVLENIGQQTALELQTAPAHHLAVALVEQQNAAFRIEHAEPLRHVFERGIQHDFLPVKFALRAAIDHGGQQRHAENGECRDRGQKRESGRRISISRRRRGSDPERA